MPPLDIGPVAGSRKLQHGANAVEEIDANAEQLWKRLMPMQMEEIDANADGRDRCQCRWKRLLPMQMEEIAAVHCQCVQMQSGALQCRAARCFPCQLATFHRVLTVPCFALFSIHVQ